MESKLGGQNGLMLEIIGTAEHYQNSLIMYSGSQNDGRIGTPATNLEAVRHAKKLLVPEEVWRGGSWSRMNSYDPRRISDILLFSLSHRIAPSRAYRSMCNLYGSRIMTLVVNQDTSKFVASPIIAPPPILQFSCLSILSSLTASDALRANESSGEEWKEDDSE
ncbi:hypothetical protein OPQ81_010013 [Rhizoctonia solani]|nr:hypothetical protein OPQ81_010013 [Rhizoctonia solani]